jgi:hypothetical protein
VKSNEPEIGIGFALAALIYADSESRAMAAGCNSLVEAVIIILLQHRQILELGLLYHEKPAI